MSIAIAVRTSEGIIVLADSASTDTATSTRRNDAEKLLVVEGNPPVAFYFGGIAYLNRKPISSYLEGACRDGFQIQKVATVLWNGWQQDYSTYGKPEAQDMHLEQIDLIAVTGCEEFQWAKIFPDDANCEVVAPPRNVIAMGCVSAHREKWGQEFSGNVCDALKFYGPIFDEVCKTDSRCGYPGKLLEWRHNSTPRIRRFENLGELELLQ